MKGKATTLWAFGTSEPRHSSSNYTLYSSIQCWRTSCNFPLESVCRLDWAILAGLLADTYEGIRASEHDHYKLRFTMAAIHYKLRFNAINSSQMEIKRRDREIKRAIHFEFVWGSFEVLLRFVWSSLRVRFEVTRSRCLPARYMAINFGQSRLIIVNQRSVD